MADSVSWMGKRANAAGNWGLNPGDFDPELVSRQLRAVGKLFGPGRYFDVHAEGLATIPDGPVMLVSNHSGGTTVIDGWGLFSAWYAQFGVERPLHGLAHEGVFATATTGRYFARSGILRAGPEVAARAVHEFGRSLIVMPGGDRDVWRSAKDRYKVCFDGRKGYARTALTLGIPIVPVAHVGAHNTLHVLTDGHAFARKVGIYKLARAKIFPVHLSFPWGLAIGPWPHLPPPTRLDYRFAPAIPCPTPTGEPVSDEAVDALDAAVRASMQAMLDELGASRRTTRHDGVDEVRARVGRSLRGLGKRLVRAVRAPVPA